jgi:hypothetical protein
VFVAVIVYPVADPGVVVAVLAVLVMVRAGRSSVTEVEQAASVPPVGQLLATASVVISVVRSSLPVAGLLTVNEAVIVTVAPGARSPVQATRPDPTTMITLPEVAAASPL